MSHRYRLTWNVATQRYVHVPDTAKGRGRPERIAVVRRVVGAAIGSLALLLTGASWG